MTLEGVRGVEREVKVVVASVEGVGLVVKMEVETEVVDITEVDSREGIRVANLVEQVVVVTVDLDIMD